MSDQELIAKVEKQISVWPRDRKTVDVPCWLPAPDFDRLIALARIGAAVQPRPISEANIEMGPFIAYVDVVNNKTGKEWTEQHLVWLDEDTGEIADDCEQGWRLGDYHSYIPLSALPTRHAESVVRTAQTIGE